jgi:hypothetical protein
MLISVYTCEHVDAPWDRVLDLKMWAANHVERSVMPRVAGREPRVRARVVTRFILQAALFSVMLRHFPR